MAKKWEKDHADPAIHAGEAMGAQRAAWQIAFQAENAHLTDQHYAQALLDLVKCFEKIPHEELITAAKKHNYCLWTLRMTLAAYRCPRTVGIDGVYSRTIVATCGITAGAGHATTELKVLLLDLILDAYKFLSDTRLILYVDDLTVQCTAGKTEVTYSIARATAWIIRYFEQKLKVQVSATKSVMIGSTTDVARKACKKMNTNKIKPARQGKTLGMSTAGGAKRSVATQKARLVKNKLKTARIHVMRKAGVNTLQMVRAAGTTSIVYNADCIGMSSSHLSAARNCVANQVAPPTRGKLNEAVLHGAGASGGRVDPAYEGHAGPIRAWATAWWQNWRSSHELNESHLAATKKLLKAKTTVWRVVTGPAAAVVATAWRIGWVFIDARQIKTEQGRTLDFLLDSPAAVADEVFRAVRRWTLGKLLRAVPSLRPAFSSCKVAADAMPPRAFCVYERAPSDWHEVPFVLGRMMHKACRSKSVKEWDRTCAPYLTSQMTNGQWPMARLHATGKGWVDSELCQLCFEAPGTLAHRASCRVTRPAVGWSAPPTVAKKFREHLSRDNRALLDTRGLAVVRAVVPAVDELEEVKWLKKVPDEWDESLLTWYIDGSTIDGPASTLSRTGVGFAAIGPRGELVAYGYAVPPWWISTTPAAEAWALGIVLGSTMVRKAVVTDCMGNLTTILNGAAWGTAANRKHARVWAPIFIALDSEERSDWLTWMPAHTGRGQIGIVLKSSGKPLTVIDHRANWLVDELAKYAAKRKRVHTYLKQLFDSAESAVGHAAALVGAQCKAANNVEKEIQLQDGTVAKVMARDSKPLGTIARRAAREKDRAKVEETRRKVEEQRNRVEALEEAGRWAMQRHDEESRRAEQWRKARLHFKLTMSYLQVSDKNEGATCVEQQVSCSRDAEEGPESCAGENKLHGDGTRKARGKKVDGYRPKAKVRTDVAAQKLNAEKQNARRSLEKKTERLRKAAGGAKKEVPLVCRPSRTATTKSESNAPRLCGATADWWEQKLRKRGLHATPTAGKKFRLTAKTAASEAAKWGIT